MEKNNRGLLITLIVLLSIIALLLSGIFTFTLISGTRSFKSFIPTKSQTVFDESYSTEDIKNITIDNNAGDIIIKNSKDGKIRVTANGNTDDEFSAAADGSTLNISNEIMNIRSFFIFGSLKKGVDIVLYLPEELDSLNINSSFGNVKIEDKLITSLTIDNDMGNIEAEKLGGSFDLNTNMGNIEIEEINITADSKAVSNMGNIDIEKTNKINIDASVSMGNSDVKDNTPNADITLTVKTDMGDIEIND